MMPSTLHTSAFSTTRRRVVAGAAAAGPAGAALFGCTLGGSATQATPRALPPGEIEFWNHWADTSPGGQGWQAVVDKFQAAHPGVVVRRVVHPSGQLYERVIAAAAAGTPPNLIDMNPTQYAAAVGRSLISKLDQYLKPAGGITRSALLPSVIEIISIANSIYAMPSEFGTQLLFYNAELLQEMGLKAPEPSWRWDGEFLDTARRATRDSGPVERQRFGVEHINNAWWDPRWRALVWSYGGDLLTRDLKKCALTDAPAIEGLQLLADFRHRWRIVPTDEARQSAQGVAQNFFEAGRLAFQPSGSFYYAQIKQRATFRWGVAQFPQGKAGSKPGTGGWLTGIGNGARHQEASWEFLSFYLQPENYALFLKFVSWTPPIKAIERPPVVEDSKHWAAMTASAQAARSLPPFPQADDVVRTMNDGLRPAFDAGTVSVRTAVQDICPRVDALLR